MYIFVAVGSENYTENPTHHMLHGGSGFGKMVAIQLSLTSGYVGSNA